MCLAQAESSIIGLGENLLGLRLQKKTLEELSGYDGFKVKNTEVLSGDQKLSLESIMDSLSVNEVEKVIRNLWKKVKESSG